MNGNDAPALPESVVVELRHLSAKAFWEEREKGLISLCQLVQDDPALFSRDVLRVMFRPLERQIRDLRSAIVREACRLVSTIVTTLENAANGIARMLLPVLSQVGISGNKIIAGYVDTCILDLVRCTHPSNAVATFSSLLCESKSKDSRLLSATCLLVIIETWPLAVIERHFEDLEPALLSALSDASSHVRETAREIYWNLKETLAEFAHRIYTRVSVRTQNMLDDHESATDAGPPDGVACSQSISSSTSSTSSRRKQLHATAPVALRHVGASMNTSTSRSLFTHTHPTGHHGLSPKAHTDSHTNSNMFHSTTSNVATSPTAHGGRVESSGEHVSVELPLLDSLVLVDAPSLQQPTAGHVRFVGETQFAAGEWVGVELEIPHGRNDGSVRGERYFSCAERYGMFVRPESVMPFTGIRKNLTATVAATDGYGGEADGAVDHTYEYHQHQQQQQQQQQTMPSDEALQSRYSFPHGVSSSPPSAPAPAQAINHRHQVDRTNVDAAPHGDRHGSSGAFNSESNFDDGDHHHHRVLQPTQGGTNGQEVSSNTPHLLHKARSPSSVAKPEHVQVSSAIYVSSLSV
jgi:hypothetical protein